MIRVANQRLRRRQPRNEASGSSRAPSFCAATISALFVMNLCGCTIGNYTPSSLPQALHAQRPINVQTLDLTKLASSYPNSETIAAGDVIEVGIASGLSSTENNTISARVAEDGSVSLPVVGRIPVAGLELAEAEATISTYCVNRDIFRSPHVTVTMKRRRTNRVTVLGAVQEPGVKELERDASDLLAAITSAGGLAEDAGTDVQIHFPRSTQGDSSRLPIAKDSTDPVQKAGHSSLGESDLTASKVSAQPRIIQVNLAQATTDAENKYTIPDGAVVRVEKRDLPPLRVIGLVKSPGEFKFPLGREVRLLDSISLAQGTSNQLADRVIVIRRLPNQTEPVVVGISLRDAKRNLEDNLMLAPGDVVSVEHSPASIAMETVRIIRFSLGASLGVIPLF